MGGLLDNNKSIHKDAKGGKKEKMNTHTDASGHLCACGLGVTSRNGLHEISGTSGRRCRSCWPKLMYGTQRRFLGLENFL